jgi:hypothetical protein
VSAWKEVDAWKSAQWEADHKRRMALLLRGCVQVATNDGTFAARRIRSEDREDRLWVTDEPEFTATTFDMLLATVDAALNKGRQA